MLKDDATGVSAATFLGRTSRGDGMRLLTSANAGVALGDGFLNVTMEVARQEVTNRAGAAPTCFGPDPSYGPCADGGKVIPLQRNGEPDYRGAGFMANAAVPIGETAEFYAFGGYSGREAVSDGLYRKADWVPRSVSYVYPDGFFPSRNRILRPLGPWRLARRHGRLVSRSQPRLWHGPFPCRSREFDHRLRSQNSSRQSGSRGCVRSPPTPDQRNTSRRDDKRSPGGH